MSDPKRLAFNYTIDVVDDDKMSLSLQFVNPSDVTSAVEPDWLVIRLENFKDTEGKVIVEEKELRMQLPNQMDPNFVELVVLAGTVAAITVATPMILQLLMKTSMNKLLSSIKNLQVLIHLTLLALQVPGPSRAFMGYIKEMVIFDLIYLVQLFGVDPEAVQAQIDAYLGYEVLEEDALPDQFV